MTKDDNIKVDLEKNFSWYFEEFIQLKMLITQPSILINKKPQKYSQHALVGM